MALLDPGTVGTRAPFGCTAWLPVMFATEDVEPALPYLMSDYRSFRSICSIEFCHLLANRLYFSSLYSAVYLIMIVLNVIIIFWMLSTPGGYDGSVSFLLLQLLVNLILVIEVAIRLISQRGRFFHHWSNIFDIVIMMVAVVTQVLYIQPPEAAAAAKEWEDIGATTFRILRDGVLFFRLYIFMKNRKKNQLSEEDHVDFSGLESEQPLILEEGMSSAPQYKPLKKPDTSLFARPDQSHAKAKRKSSRRKHGSRGTSSRSRQ